MSYAIIPFNSMPWVAGNHPLETKKSDRETTLLRFAAGFSDPNWCVRSHVLFVVEGTLEVEFENESIALAAGQACRIEAGTKHRAKNPEASEAVVLAVSDLTHVS